MLYKCTEWGLTSEKLFDNQQALNGLTESNSW